MAGGMPDQAVLLVGGEGTRLRPITSRVPKPVAPVVERPDYRMLAAVIPTDQGNYFIKFYGPKRTVGAQAAAFQKMLAGLR